MNRNLVAAAMVLGLSSLAGCGANDNNGVKNRANNGAERIQDIGDNVNNGRLRNEERIEDKVEKMRKVDRAHVIVSKNNAYVALRLNDDHNNNRLGTRSDRGRINNIGPNGDMVDNNNGVGTYGGVGDGNRYQDHTGIRNNDDNNHSGNISGNNNGMINGGRNNAGDNMFDNNNNNNDNNYKNKRDYSKVDTKFEQQVADQVRKADSSIHKVYVSSDRGFYDRMSDYADDIRNGNNDGLLNNFNDYVRGFFNINNR
ncbi:YhcN/YlaJ family sporulation lipoprotein [Peribacillus kribbensis]|uniref:YhcN/YlaJ family sporulation lipoprotein n=1 Tax=Peribacillus kribbensis TaxID=356658 RepID=UPI000421AE13|nr:YhcN/YlaJ family sporulation lipoprotein [Peribacillus kribbensis]